MENIFYAWKSKRNFLFDETQAHSFTRFNGVEQEKYFQFAIRLEGKYFIRRIIIILRILLKKGKRDLKKPNQILNRCSPSIHFEW